MLYGLLLIGGFIPLVYGASLLVDSASSLAKRYNIPNIVIGLTIVAFGTSAPELVVNVSASFSKVSDIVLGNVVGSNIFNILFILGIAALIRPLEVKTNTTWIEVPLSFLSAVVVFILANDILIDNKTVSFISRIDGIILLLFFIIFMAYNFQLMKKGDFEEEIEVKNYTTLKSILYILLGLALLIVGGKLIVDNAVKVARLIGISERIIALTIVSIGTSLPELATSVVAAKKKNVDIAIGNIVGSNIFNAFFILGASAIVYPVTIQKLSNLDLSANIFASLLLFVFIFTGKGRKIELWEGVIFILSYIGYITALILI